MRKALLQAFFVSAALLASSSLAWSADATKLSFSIWQQPQHYMVKAIQKWASDVEARSEGSVKIEFYFGGTLTKGSQAYDGVLKGISDMAAAASGWNPGKFPLTRITDIPLGWTSSLQASRVSWDYYKKFKPKEWDNVHLLFLYTDGIGNLHSKAPINGIGDLKGMRVRGTGSDVPLIKAMGGSPVGMPWGEVYLSLQRGIVDAMISNYASFKAAKLGEVTDYTTEYNIRSAGFWVAMNKAKWNSLNAQQQKAFTDASEAAVDMVGKALDDAQAGGRQYALDIGDKIITPTDAEKAKFDAALAPARDEWLAEMKSKGLPGQEVLDFVTKAMMDHKG